MIAASTGFGRWCSSVAKNTSVSSTNVADTSDDTPVRAPADRLSAERENEPLTGMVWLNPAASLARPWPISSWFSSHGVRVLRAMILQLDMASMKLISAMTKAAGSSAMVACQSKAGTVRLGSPGGMSPTTRPPIAS